MSRFPKHHDRGMHRSANEAIDQIEKEIRNVIQPQLLTVLHGCEKEKNLKSPCKECRRPACCYLHTFVTIYETLPLVRHLRMTHKATKPFISKLRAEGEWMEGAGRADWFDKVRRPCLFLNSEKRCDIYEHRPLVCRQYWVFTPVENCQYGAEDDNICSPDTKEVQEFVIGRSADLLKGMGLLGDGRVYIGTFPRILAILLEAFSMPTGDQQAYIKSQPYPLAKDCEEWRNGANPFKKSQPV